MIKYKNNIDGEKCKSCIGYTSCLTWMQKELKAKRDSCYGWYYANKEQVEDMLEYWESKTMKNLDFKKGDKVYSLQFGNGIVTEIKPKEYKEHVIRVKFKDNDCLYNYNGKYNDSEVIRSLYHGHNLNVQVDEKMPIRKVNKWAFLYFCPTNQEPRISKQYDTKFDCEAGIFNAVNFFSFTVLSEPIKIQEINTKNKYLMKY